MYTYVLLTKYIFVWRPLENRIRRMPNTEGACFRAASRLPCRLLTAFVFVLDASITECCGVRHVLDTCAMYRM